MKLDAEIWGGRTSVILAAVPACNEERTIGRVVIGALRHADKVLVVDDGSSDLTGQIAEKLGAVVVRHERNFGKGEALRTIFNWARRNGADVLVTLDADGQHLPEEIPTVLSPVIEGNADISIGSRFVEQALSEMPNHRRWGMRVIGSVVRSVSGSPVRDTESGFRAYGRKALQILLPSEMGMGVDSELLLRANERGLTITEVPIKVAYKGLATSTHHPVYHALDVLFSIAKYVSIRHPLLFYGVSGLIALLIGLSLGFQAFDAYSRHGIFPTNVGIVAVGASLMGVILLSVGIMLFSLITVLRERS
jgi:glycosyltransferase involved in cell wall biosynthesis